MESIPSKSSLKISNFMMKLSQLVISCRKPSPSSPPLPHKMFHNKLDINNHHPHHLRNICG